MIFEVSRCSKMGPQNGPKIDQKWTPRGSKIVSKIDVLFSAVFASILEGFGDLFGGPFGLSGAAWRCPKTGEKVNGKRTL